MTAVKKINIEEKLGLFAEQWRPKIIARVNDLDVRIAKLEGEFVWHAHGESDEMFLVVKGELVIHLRGGDLTLGEGEMAVVPRGTEHKPECTSEAHVMVITREDVVNTGDAGGARTAEAEWLT
jgi:mannose-6-phosphate isomerase-like protein (cupin superfamily)